MGNFDYVAELFSPRLTTNADGSMPTPPQVEAYLAMIEDMRQEFLSRLPEKDDKALRACLCNVEDARKEIKKRGYCKLKENCVTDAVIGEVPGAQAMMILKWIDSSLYTSVERTINYIKHILEEEGIKPIATPITTQETECIVENTKENEGKEIVKGVKGLASVLGCGTTKAQAIINSKVLMKTKPAIQYNAGGWRFHRQRLQEYIESHPQVFSNIKCPH